MTTDLYANVLATLAEALQADGNIRTAAESRLNQFGKHQQGGYPCSLAFANARVLLLVLGNTMVLGPR
jgi:hypothetical protein